MVGNTTAQLSRHKLGAEQKEACLEGGRLEPPRRYPEKQADEVHGATSPPVPGWGSGVQRREGNEISWNGSLI